MASNAKSVLLRESLWIFDPTGIDTYLLVEFEAQDYGKPLNAIGSSKPVASSWPVLGLQSGSKSEFRVVGRNPQS